MHIRNNDHGESVLLVSSLSVLIVLLVVAAIFLVVHTAFLVMLTALVSAVLNRSSVNLAEPDSFYFCRLFVNSALCINCCNYSLSAKYEHMQNHSNLFEHKEK